MTHRFVRLAVVASLGLAAPLLAACGGDDDDAGTTTDTGAEDAASDDATADDTTTRTTTPPATTPPATTPPATTPQASDPGDADSDDAASGDGADDSDEVDAAGQATGDGDSMLIDGSDIDWATVDLATIDWENIDMATVDIDALPLNPTVENLSPETIALVQERFASEFGGGSGGSAAGSGMATLTIGGETWEFDDFVCAVGYANTQSDVFSFSSNAFGELADGTRTQLQANIWDDTGADALTGVDTDHEITFDDIDNFDDPAVDWLMTGTELTIDGFQVSAEGIFRDAGTGAEQPGSFAGECGPGSRF